MASRQRVLFLIPLLALVPLSFLFLEPLTLFSHISQATTALSIKSYPLRGVLHPARLLVNSRAGDEADTEMPVMYERRVSTIIGNLGSTMNVSHWYVQNFPTSFGARVW